MRRVTRGYPPGPDENRAAVVERNVTESPRWIAAPRRQVALTLVAAAAVALAISARGAEAPEAQDAPSPAPPTWVELDLDPDGSVDLEEYLAFQAQRMPLLDSDGGGSLSLTEFMASLPERARGRASAAFQGFDFDGNRRLSRAEFLLYHSVIFRRYIDTDGDRRASAAELARAAAGRE